MNKRKKDRDVATKAEVDKGERQRCMTTPPLSMGSIREAEVIYGVDKGGRGR
jgi:hypothetical protein